MPLRRVLGHRRDASIRCQRPAKAEAGRLGTHRRYRAPHAAPERQGVCGRPANGRDQPRRQAGVLDQLALLDVGRPVLSRRCSGRHGDGQREAGRRPRTGQGLLGQFPRRVPGAPNPARRRRLFDGFVLLSVGLNLSGASWTPAWLWLAVIASGLYHGVNPGMGWPLAVSAGLMERSSRALLAALGPLTAGHLLATLLVILPFALLVALIEWHRQIQIGASLLVIAFGIFRLLDRRHPRALARIRPTQLGLWSFAVAIAHGAGLMLLPIYLGLCRAADFDKGHEAATTLINANLGMAVLVAFVHAMAMIAAGGCSAWLVYRYLGVKFVARSWFNLDTSWAASLILVGAIALVLGLAE